MVNSPPRNRDLCVAFCRALVSRAANNDQERVRSSVISNPRLAQMMGRFNAKKGAERSFVDMLNEVPKLQEALAKVAWGILDNSDDQ